MKKFLTTAAIFFMASATSFAQQTQTLTEDPSLIAKILKAVNVDLAQARKALADAPAILPIMREDFQNRVNNLVLAQKELSERHHIADLQYSINEDTQQHDFLVDWAANHSDTPGIASETLRRAEEKNKAIQSEKAKLLTLQKDCLTCKTVATDLSLGKNPTNPLVLYTVPSSLDPNSLGGSRMTHADLACALLYQAKHTKSAPPIDDPKVQASCGDSGPGDVAVEDHPEAKELAIPPGSQRTYLIAPLRQEAVQTQSSQLFGASPANDPPTKPQ